jgi:signal transduction histidine kinase
MASNALGLWNGPQNGVVFRIQPAFWQTWWFRVTCFVLLLAALRMIYVLRLRHVTTLLRLRHQERLSERENIARDLHDTFFQSVQSLFLRLHTASRNLPEHNPTRQALEELLNDSDRVMLEGREAFLDVPRKESRDRDFADLIAGYCAEFAMTHPIEYMVQVDGPPRSLNPLVTEELSKIAREAIYNAFRHSKARAIEIELIYGKSEMQLRIRDNGQGFEPTLLQANAGHLHLGLQNMRKRAEKLDAEFKLWSRLGLGTELEIILGAQRAYSTTERAWTFPGLEHKG